MAENDNEKPVTYADDEEQESGIFRWMSALVVLLAVAGFFGLAWYAYKSGGEAVDEKDVELVKADSTPVKEAPANPGGMQIPNQDKTVYGLINGGKTEKPTVERILPAPEEPLARGGDTETWMSDKARKTISGDDSARPVEAPLAPVSPSADDSTPKKSEQFNPAKAVKDAGTQQMAAAEPQTASPAAGETKPSPQPSATPAPSPAPQPEVKKQPVQSAPTLAQQKVPMTANPPADESESEAAPAAAGAAFTPPSKGPRVQLGAYKSQAEADSNWVKISKQFSSAMKGKSHYVVRVDLGDKGVFYRLQVAPFASAKEAEQFCMGFLSDGRGCFLAKAK